MTPNAPAPARTVDLATPAAAAANAAQRHSHGVTLPLAVVGCDFRVASAQWRHQLLLSEAERQALTDGMRVAAGATGLVVVETCNRVEWLCSSPIPQWAGDVLRAQMLERWARMGGSGAPDQAHMPNPYVYAGRSAVRHLLRVAVGLESFVAGEREIAGQLNRALATARLAGHGSVFHNALQTALGRTVKKVQRLTTWRHHGRGVHSVALDAVVRHVKAHALPGRPSVTVVGMGEIGRKTADLLAGVAKCRVVRINRTLPADGRGDWRPLSELAASAAQSDAVVVATGARDAIATVDDLCRGRAPDRPPLLVVDLGAPAQVVGHGHAHAVLLTLDDLLNLPAVAADDAETAHVVELVEEGLREFVLECRKRSLAGLLRAVHDCYDSAAYQLLPDLLAAELGDRPAEERARLEIALRELLRNFTRDVVQHVETTADESGRAQRRAEPRPA